MLKAKDKITVVLIVSFFLIGLGTGQAEYALPKNLSVATAMVQRTYEVGVKKIRIATYNIRHGLSVDGRLNLAGISEAIQSLDADIILLTEVDVGRARSDHVDQAEFLAKENAYPYYYYAPALPPTASYPRESTRKPGLYGLALLSRFPILEAKKYLLPGLIGFEPRVLLMATLSLYGKDFKVFGIHLALNERLRLRQIDWLLRKVFLSGEAPSIILGDLNADRDSPEVARLIQSGFRDGAEYLGKEVLTFPSSSPNYQVDYIFLDRYLLSKVAEAGSQPGSQSDHLAYYLDLVLD